jgi:hypothetical protein
MKKEEFIFLVLMMLLPTAGSFWAALTTLDFTSLFGGQTRGIE